MRLDRDSIQQVFVPLLSMLIAIVTVVSSATISLRQQYQEVDLKRSEIALRENQIAYADLMEQIESALLESMKKNCCPEKILEYEIKMAKVVHRIEPFLTEKSRATLWSDIQVLRGILTKVFEQRGVPSETTRGMLAEYFNTKRKISKFLLHELFEGNPIVLRNQV